MNNCGALQMEWCVPCIGYTAVLHNQHAPAYMYASVCRVGIITIHTLDLKSNISHMAMSVFIFCVTAAGILAEQWDVVLPARKHLNARLHMMVGPGSVCAATGYLSCIVESTKGCKVTD